MEVVIESTPTYLSHLIRYVCVFTMMVYMFKKVFLSELLYETHKTTFNNYSINN